MLRHSMLCEGQVRHWRKAPKTHRFQYPVYMTWLDLDEIEELNRLPFWSSKRFNLVRYKRRDYFGGDVHTDDVYADAAQRSPRVNASQCSDDLKEAVLKRVFEDIEKLSEPSINLPDPKTSRVVLLAHLRTWGMCFNPVAFYFCFDEHDNLFAIMGEINNTPWDERHAYVLPVKPDEADAETHIFNFPKQFHVSPFMPMDMQYEWRFRLTEMHINVHMRLLENSEEVFTAAMNLQRKPLTSRNALFLPLKYPFMCAQVVAAIYWQALRLWLKRVPFHSHPQKSHPEKQIKTQEELS